MATKRTRNDFINFLIDSEKNPKLTDEFLSKNTAKDLYSFFHEKGYKDIPYNDCQDILTAKNRMGGRHIPKKGQTAKRACVPGGKAY